MANFKEHGRLQMTPDAWEACLYALDVFFMEVTHQFNQ